MYKNMCEVLQEKQQGVARLNKFKAEGFWALRQGIPTGEYIRLLVDGELMMSNTPMEKRTSAPFVTNAEGDVLICGLGIGLVILPLLESEKVKSITVVEKYQDVIDIVLPQIKGYDTENKLTVICEDCFKFKTDKKFDTVFIDIWANINSDIYKEEMKPLKRKYRSFLREERQTMDNVYVWAEREARYDLRLA
jgi:hypothetical protein